MGETPTQRINRLDSAVAILSERLDGLLVRVEAIEDDASRADERTRGAGTQLAVVVREIEKFKEIKEDALRSGERFRDADLKLAVVSRDVEKLEKRVDDLLSRRWELWKLILAAFLGSVLTVASGFVGRSLERLVVPASKQPGSAAQVPVRR